MKKQVRCSTVQKYTVRANRGRARIWLEGKRLENAAFTVGARFDIESGDGDLLLCLDPNGSRKVSGKGERPIIDLSGRSCAPFKTGDAVEVEYYPYHGIVIREAINNG